MWYVLEILKVAGLILFAAFIVFLCSVFIDFILILVFDGSNGLITRLIELHSFEKLPSNLRFYFIIGGLAVFGRRYFARSNDHR